MPHSQGMSLKQFIKDGGTTLNEDVIRFIVSQIVLAIEDLHSKNIMHRNINPNSIIIEKDGFIKLTSFEHAKIFSDEQLENSNP